MKGFKSKGYITINNKLTVPATFLIVINGNNSFYTFTNLGINKDDYVSCELPENIKLCGFIEQTGELPSSVYHIIDTHLYKSVIRLDKDSIQMIEELSRSL
jgi:hypothetical protein